MAVYWPIMTRTPIYLILSVLLLCVSNQASSQEHFITYPFESKVARDNLKICLGGQSNANFDYLKRVKSIQYRMDKIDECPTKECREGLQWVKFKNTIAIDLSELSSDNIQGLFKRMEKRSGCDRSTMTKFKYNQSANKISYSVRAYYHDRACSDFPRFKTTKSKVRGTISGNISLNEDYEVVASKPKLSQVKLSGIAKLAGFLTNTKKKLRKAVPKNSSFNVLNTMRSADMSQVNTILDDFTPLKINYTTDPSLSGFDFEDRDPAIKITRIGYSGKSSSDDILKAYNNEYTKLFKFFRSLSEIDSKTHKVEHRDSLWSIAEEYFGDGRFFLYLKAKNSIENVEHLSIGDLIEIPTWKEFCEDMNSTSELVANGNNLWDMKLENRIPYIPDSESLHSGNVDLIYPLEMINVP